MWFLINLLFFLGNVCSFAFIYRQELYRLFVILPYGYQVYLTFLVLSLKLRFQQWYGKNVEKTETGQYVVSLILGGRLVKLLVELENDPPVMIEDDEGVDITDDALPYFRAKHCRVGPDSFMSEKLVLWYDDDSMIELTDTLST